MRSLLRRPAASQETHLRVGDLELDLLRHHAFRGGEPLHLTGKEFVLLAHLVRAAGEVVSRQEVSGHVWGIDFRTSTNVLDVMMRRLRAKVDDPFPKKLIHTVRGAGYVIAAS
jgi:two-component system copper resistance phosphate regulon response regulator CusR